MRRSGLHSGWSLALALLTLVVGACWPYGFAGGGLPEHVRTVAVLPFENETPQPELQREVWESLRREMQSRLGLRDAPEARADAVVRGTLVRYEPDIPIAFAAVGRQPTSARRKLQIVCDIEIVDQKTGRVLWERRGLIAEGEYNEGAEPNGRRVALQRLVNDVIDGAQSQW
ncbi:MAG TPA: LPS assembly lipoprotein LptE [Gemmatimonadaceae bacterium]|nr:LPS assembly lipoprotein LptE [Gemmatimonadaceae bacterium]